jgi:hypothetical protein
MLLVGKLTTLGYKNILQAISLLLRSSRGKDAVSGSCLMRMAMPSPWNMSTNA